MLKTDVYNVDGLFKDIKYPFVRAEMVVPMVSCWWDIVAQATAVSLE